VVASRAHDGDDLLDFGRVGGIAKTLISRRPTNMEAGHRCRRSASTSAVKQHLGHCPSSGSGNEPSIRREHSLDRSSTEMEPVRPSGGYRRSSKATLRAMLAGLPSAGI